MGLYHQCCAASPAASWLAEEKEDMAAASVSNKTDKHILIVEQGVVLPHQSLFVASQYILKVGR